MTVLLLSHLLGCTKRSDNRSPSINHTTPSDNPFALDTPTPQVLSTIPAGDLSCPLFDDVAQQSGLDFTYHNGEAGKSLMVEAIGGGAGWLDIDGDGFWDLYLVQGGDPTAKTHAGQPNDQIFRNHGNGQFVDITSQTRIDQRAYGQGVSIADFDNDGFDDIYITNVGPNTLLQNMGDGTFVDVTQAAGVGGTSWSSSAAWGDLDRDGDVDLYVCNYLDYDPRSPWDCRNSRGEPRICHPRDIDPVPDELFINQGDGTFVSAAPSLGLFGPGNKALGVAICELTGDQYIDIYVANDTEANFLFVGNENGRFEESALALGCAVDRNGHTQASMGVAVGDYDSDRFDDLYITHFYDESNTLYHSLGPLGFDDVTPRVELHHATLPRLGFGCVMHDFAGNGQQALLIANGHIENFPGNPLLKMKPQLFAWTGQQWHDCSKNAGTFFEKKQV
ncbi:MAG: VCBS repeat-containing protein, partial [Pirellulales bacterium]